MIAHTQPLQSMVFAHNMRYSKIDLHIKVGKANANENQLHVKNVCANVQLHIVKKTRAIEPCANTWGHAIEPCANTWGHAIEPCANTWGHAIEPCANTWGHATGPCANTWGHATGPCANTGCIHVAFLSSATWWD